MGRPDDPKGCPVASGGQGAGIAVGEDAGSVGHQLRPRFAHGLVHLDILRVDGQGFRLQPGQAEGLPAPLHPVQRPKQVHRSGPAGGQDLLGPGHGGREICFTAVLPCGQHGGIGGGNPDCGRSPDHHRFDGLGYLAVVGVPQPSLNSGQAGLVQKIEGIVFPADGFHKNPHF